MNPGSGDGTGLCHFPYEHRTPHPWTACERHTGDVCFGWHFENAHCVWHWNDSAESHTKTSKMYDLLSAVWTSATITPIMNKWPPAPREPACAGLSHVFLLMTWTVASFPFLTFAAKWNEH